MTKQKAFPFEPAAGKILVKQEEALKITSGGIEIPDSAKMRPMEGVVIAIGQDSFLSKSEQERLPYKTKDRVLFGKYDGIEVRIDEEDFLLLDQDQILGKRTVS